MNIDTPDTDAADALADLWVELASEQRQHSSRLLPAENRSEIRGHVLQAIVTDGVRVARADSDDLESVDTDGVVDVAAGDIVGFVMFGLEQGVFERSTTRGIIQNLYVRPAFRDAGVGSELLAAAEDALAERGVGAIKLDVMADNEAGRRFYSRHGYSHHRVTLEKPVESDNHKTE